MRWKQKCILTSIYSSEAKVVDCSIAIGNEVVLNIFNVWRKKKNALKFFPTDQ